MLQVRAAHCDRIDEIDYPGAEGLIAGPMTMTHAEGPTVCGPSGPLHRTKEYMMTDPDVAQRSPIAGTSAFSGFSVDDIPQAKAFYAETLGVDVTEANGMLTLHTAGGRDTLIYPKPDHLAAAFTVLNFRVPEVEAAVDALADRGVVFQKYDFVDEKGINRRGGPLIAWFSDPAGNILSVIQE